VGEGRAVDLVARILFRVVVVYTLVLGGITLAVIPKGRPWELEELEDSRGFRPSACTIERGERRIHVSPDDACQLLEEGALAHRELSSECSAYCGQPTEVKANWRRSGYWTRAGWAAALFIAPAWLLWAAIRWAIIAPIRGRR